MGRDWRGSTLLLPNQTTEILDLGPILSTQWLIMGIGQETWPKKMMDVYVMDLPHPKQILENKVELVRVCLFAL